MKFQRIDTINVIPFIDIMLVLLVIVLTSTSFIKQGSIPVNLPQTSKANNSSKKEAIPIAIKADGTIFFKKKPITLETLASSLKDIQPTTHIELYSDKKASFENFVGVMEILTTLKLKNIYIVTIKK